jgi:hypothetical protein
MKSTPTKKWLITAVIGGASAFAAPASAVQPPRIELLRAVSVSGAIVSLSDLLPAGASHALRAEAGEVSLGAAPQPGRTRTIERSGILSEMEASPDLSEAIAVPERVAVSRDARPITADEIFVAIQHALGEVHASNAKGLSPENVFLVSQILVKAGDPGLEVLRADFDPGMKRARFLLWPSRDPNVLPFYVAAAFPGHSGRIGIAPGGKHSSGGLNEKHAASAAVRNAKPEILVSPSENATLILLSASLNMILDVMPLERGTLGQQVRVRVADTGKVFLAKVDGRAHLQLNF